MTEEFRLKKLAKLISDRNTILDIGCSENPNIFLKNNQVIGVDLLERQLPSNYTSLRICDVMKLSEEFNHDEINGILAGEIIEHIEDPIKFLKECYNVLAKNGLLVLSTPNPNSLIERLLTMGLSRRFFYTKNHIMLYPQRWLIRIMEIAGFENVKLYSGGMLFPFFSLLPFPRPWCYQTIATGEKSSS